jgi:flagellar hook protein FlgE
MSFQQGLSGLNATSKSLEVIGNNIANANTFGAKASRAEFADMYAASLNGTGSSSIGIGTQVANVAQQFSQGNVTATANPMDLAINGRGFFMLQDTAGREVVSRNGQFSIDRNGYVVNSQDMKLLAKQWDESVGRGVLEPVPIRIVRSGGDAIKTGEGEVNQDRGVRLTMNFDAGTPVVPGRTPFAVDNTSSYDFSTSQTVYDGQGLPLAMTYYFRKEAADEWNVFASIDGMGIDPVLGTVHHPDLEEMPAATPIARLSFGSDGRLARVRDAAGEEMPPGAKVRMSINDPRLTTTAGGAVLPADEQTALYEDLPFDLAGSTQLGASFSVSDLRQDGYRPGDLLGVSFDSNGILKASYSNGRYLNLAQVQLADFANVQGLKAMGGNVWEQTFQSGPPVINAAGSNSMGLLQSGALEASNIDLTAELVNMITAQRIYQANAQTIKTVDQVMQTLVNLR